MTFTSGVFLIGLLPWFVVLFYLFRNSKNMKKFLLLLANSSFYFWGGMGAFVFVVCYSAVIWLFHCLLFRTRRKILLAGSVLICLVPLLIVKYTDFVISNLNAISGASIAAPSMIVPIGISFFTFEAVSLLCDTYKGEIERRASVIDVFLYLSFFPTVTSGPIIRFHDMQSGLEIQNAVIAAPGVAVERVVLGLAKKVLIADKIAILADYYFNGVAAGNTYSACGLWLGSIAYSLQLYFDFSGYSDMAIGIGQLLGFQIKENFDRPYLANSISDFWRRWHISLSQWFRDYVYIPLGGNRCAVPRHILNLLVVWALTGIWHGADWTFVVWGVAYFVLLVIEKYVPAMKRIGSHWYGHLYALFFIDLLWIPFRASGMATAGKYISGMFGANGHVPLEEKALNYLPLLLLSAVLCLPWSRYVKRFEQRKWFAVIKGVPLLILAGLAICATVNAGYAPYIYGSF